MHVVIELPNYLKNPSKKEEVTNFVCNMLEEERDTEFGYGSNGEADKVVDLDKKQILYRYSYYFQ